MLAKVVVAAAALVAGVSAQAVTSKISPSSPAPSGCVSSMSSPFNIIVVNATTSSSAKKAKRQADDLTITLSNGVLTDATGHTGYIAANQQFQFDNPPQAGAIYTAGWSVCPNGTLALGGESIFYECLSGTFYNLYDASQGAQCSPIYIYAQAAGGASSTTAAATTIPDGQPQGTTAASASVVSAGSTVTAISDNQIQAPTTASASTVTPKSTITAISDNQIQAPTSVTASATTVTPKSTVTAISDNQIQAPTSVTPYTSSKTVAPYTGAAAMPTVAAQLLLGAAAVAAYAL